MINLPRVLSSERDFQLRRCERFAVYAGARPLGVVDGIRYESRTDRPDLLEVRSGRFGKRLVLIQVSDVEAIDPDEEVVIVSEGCWTPRIRGAASSTRPTTTSSW